MSLPAIGLILLAALFHATWNLLAKRVQGGAAFIWLYNVITLVLFAPIVLLFIFLAHLSLYPGMLLWIIGSGLLELAYFLLLQRGYRIGDLSLVYPLARGTGPLLTTIVAIFVLQEHPAPLALIGTGCIVCGVVLIAWKPQRLNERRVRLAILYGILTGCCIAGYTLWDNEALSVGQMAPLILYYGTIGVCAPALTPFALRHWPDVRKHWHNHLRAALGIAVLSTLAYVLVLTALTFTPVSSVASAREVSVLFGTLLGTRLLAEGDTKRRLLAAGLIVIGIVALAV